MLVSCHHVLKLPPNGMCRQLSHEAFKCPKPLEFFFAYIGALAFEGDPMEWQRGHLWHHIHSDTPADRC